MSETEQAVTLPDRIFAFKRADGGNSWHYQRLEESDVEYVRAAPQGDAWLPIETAPKDGTRVLLGFSVVRAWSVVAHWTNGDWSLTGDGERAQRLYGRPAPKLWMPLPPLPPFAAAATPVTAPVSTGEPIDMVLFCPRCGTQHVDAPEDEETFRRRAAALNSVAELEEGIAPRWTNPPHKSHLCHNCYAVWRPADVPTNGVKQIKTRGERDNTWTNSAAVPATTPDGEQERQDAVRLAEAVMGVFGNPGISPQTWDRLVEVCATTPPPAVTERDYEEVLADHRRLVRELDVLLNGENAAPQASLVDIVAQLRARPAVTEAGEQERETGTNGHVHKFGIVKVSPELGHSYRRCSECLLSVYLKGHDPARCELCASERRELPPFCAVHSEIEKRDGLELEIGNNCIACSLHERSLLLGMLEPFAARDGSQDSPTVLRGIINAAAPPSTSAAIRAAAEKSEPAHPLIVRDHYHVDTLGHIAKRRCSCSLNAPPHRFVCAVCVESERLATPAAPSPGEPRDKAGDGRYCRHHDDDPSHGAICYDSTIYEG